MTFGLTGIHGQAAGHVAERARNIGLACMLAGRKTHHAKAPLSRLVRQLECALAHDQIKFYFNDFGQCMGYVCWAWLTDEIVDRVWQEPDYALHLSEWHEGTRAHIVDLVVPDGALRAVLADVRESLFAGHDSFTYIRWKKGPCLSTAPPLPGAAKNARGTDLNRRRAGASFVSWPRLPANIEVATNFREIRCVC